MIHSFNYPFILYFTYAFIYLFYSFIPFHSLTHSFFQLFIYSFIHAFILYSILCYSFFVFIHCIFYCMLSFFFCIIMFYSLILFIHSFVPSFIHSHIENVSVRTCVPIVMTRCMYRVYCAVHYCRCQYIVRQIYSSKYSKPYRLHSVVYAYLPLALTTETSLYTQLNYR